MAAEASQEPWADHQRMVNEYVARTLLRPYLDVSREVSEPCMNEDEETSSERSDDEEYIDTQVKVRDFDGKRLVPTIDAAIEELVPGRAEGQAVAEPKPKPPGSASDVFNVPAPDWCQELLAKLLQRASNEMATPAPSAESEARPVWENACDFEMDKAEKRSVAGQRRASMEPYRPPTESLWGQIDAFAQMCRQKSRNDPGKIADAVTSSTASDLHEVPRRRPCSAQRHMTSSQDLEDEGITVEEDAECACLHSEDCEEAAAREAPLDTRQVRISFAKHCTVRRYKEPRNERNLLDQAYFRLSEERRATKLNEGFSSDDEDPDDMGALLRRMANGDDDTCVDPSAAYDPEVVDDRVSPSLRPESRRRQMEEQEARERAADDEEQMIEAYDRSQCRRGFGSVEITEEETEESVNAAETAGKEVTTKIGPDSEKPIVAKVYDSSGLGNERKEPNNERSQVQGSQEAATDAEIQGITMNSFARVITQEGEKGCTGMGCFKTAPPSSCTESAEKHTTSLMQEPTGAEKLVCKLYEESNRQEESSTDLDERFLDMAVDSGLSSSGGSGGSIEEPHIEIQGQDDTAAQTDYGGLNERTASPCSA